MKKVFVACAACLLLLTSMVAVKSTIGGAHPVNTTATATTTNHTNSALQAAYWVDSLYNRMELANKGLSREVFFAACKGYELMLLENTLRKKGVLTICDFSQRSDKKRMYVLDLDAAKVLFHTYVSHGRNSGGSYATSFSNSNESHKTCLGFMRTAETYIGENGYSMRLDGMEKGFNHNARHRAIVMHGSDYVHAARAANGTMMGRSYGCPAVPVAEVKKIINQIKGGSCFFNYYPDKMYTASSRILNSDFTWPVTQTPQLAAVTIPDSLASIYAAADPVN